MFSLCVIAVDQIKRINLQCLITQLVQISHTFSSSFDFMEPSSEVRIFYLAMTCRTRGDFQQRVKEDKQNDSQVEMFRWTFIRSGKDTGHIQHRNPPRVTALQTTNSLNGRFLR